MLNNVLLQRTVVRVGPDCRYLCFRDLDAAAGLRPCLIHLAAGGTVVFAAETEPGNFFEAAARHGATHASASPGLLRSLVAHAPPKGAPSLKHFEIGGAALQFALAGEAAAKITPHVLSTYGASETGRIAIAPIDLLRKASGCSGWFVPWVETQVLGEGGRVLPQGERGALRFRGVGFADGYVDDPEASAKAFRDGWFYSGDAGRIDPRGLLFVEGRVDDLVNLGGAKIAPSLVEKVLETHPAVVEAAAFGSKSASGVERLYAAVVTRKPVEEKALVEHCRAKLGSMAPSRVFTLAELPRNENGKLLRRELAKRVVARDAAR
jgi:acyl-coenzyme A synthetase/AMP-(fatty) acid ligase